MIFNQQKVISRIFKKLMTTILTIALLNLNFVISIKFINFTVQNDNVYLREKKAILSNNLHLWVEKEITYYVDSRLNVEVIDYSLLKIKKETCLTFKRKSILSQALFVYLPGTCYQTNLGKGREIPHKIFIPINDNSVGKTIRETMRALGVDYEHNRYDRDNFVNVNFCCIHSRFKKFFKKKSFEEVQTFGSSYDYRSIMHFSSGEYTIFGRKCITSKDNYMRNLMGLTSELSFNDAKLLNKKYCTNRNAQDLNCLNNGYQHPRNHRICKCLSFIGGNHCEMLGNNILPCRLNNVFRANSFMVNQYIYVGGKCAYFVVASVDKAIKLSLTFSTLTLNIAKCTEKNSIEIMYRRDISVSGILFCPGSSLEITSETNIIVIRSNFSPNRDLILRLLYVEV